MKIVKNNNKENSEDQLLNIIKDFSMEQLYKINEVVVERIKMLEKIKDFEAISSFRRGHKVKWVYEGREFEGVVVKVNQKTVNVAEKDPPYKSWRISPQWLQIIGD